MYRDTSYTKKLLEVSIVRKINSPRIVTERFQVYWTLHTPSRAADSQPQGDCILVKIGWHASASVGVASETRQQADTDDAVDGRRRPFWCKRMCCEMALEASSGVSCWSPRAWSDSATESRIFTASACTMRKYSNSFPSGLNLPRILTPFRQDSHTEATGYVTLPATSANLSRNLPPSHT